MVCRLSLVAGLFLMLVTARAAPPEPAVPEMGFRIVGYLPDYRAPEFDLAAAHGLTDLIIFSAEANVDGQLNMDRLKSFPWSRIQQFKTRQRVRLILCIGGWDRSQHFAGVSAAPDLRQKFVQSVLQTCLEQRLDGVDLDWEHPHNEAEQACYGSLLKELHDLLEPRGILVSVTMAAWQKLPREAFEAVDAVHVMSYDNSGKHSTFETAQADIKSMRDQGAPAGKIVLGVPFYGRHTAQRDLTLTYREIVKKYNPAADTDEVDSIYFNGPRMVRKKTRLALDAKLAGVMFWELGQDGIGKRSLVRAATEEVTAQRK